MRDATKKCRQNQDGAVRGPFVSVQDVCKSYGLGEGKAQVLKDLSLEVAQGELCAILGASGSGKSTLLNVVGGLDEVDSGRICVGGCDVTALGPSQLLEYRRDFLGFVFQFYNLVPNLTVRENIQVTSYLSANPLDMQEFIETLGLSAHADKFPSQLSGGQQQRCAIARALVKKPQLLLCDEPTGALDSATSLEILGLLEQVNRSFGTTMLIVTHNEGITAMCDQVVRIKDGSVVSSVGNAHKLSASEIEL